MTLLEAIYKRHSVRSYSSRQLEDNVIDALQERIAQLNALGRLNMQLVIEEPKAFTGILSYGQFFGVKNYIVVAGLKDDSLSERAGYFGEDLVLFAQTLGLNTCWVGLSYRKVRDAFKLNRGEKIVCFISLGYGISEGQAHKTRPIEELSNADKNTPEWFNAGIEAVRLAPSAINQQKYYFRYLPPKIFGEKARVEARSRFSLVGYTGVDLGIAKQHFEIAAGKENFEWA